MYPIDFSDVENFDAFVPLLRPDDLAHLSEYGFVIIDDPVDPECGTVFESFADIRSFSFDEAAGTYDSPFFITSDAVYSVFLFSCQSLGADSLNGRYPENEVSVFHNSSSFSGSLPQMSCSSYPLFMYTSLWNQKQVNVVAAADRLTQSGLRFCENGFAGMPPFAVYSGYVEPVPDLYKMMADVLDTAPDGRARPFRMLQTISEKELRREALTPGEIAFIHTFIQLCPLPDGSESVSDVNDIFDRNCLVIGSLSGANADISGESGDNIRVTQAATGYVKWIVAACPTTNYESEYDYYLCVGPILPYYEIDVPADEQMTDEEWKTYLQNEKPTPKYLI